MITNQYKTKLDTFITEEYKTIKEIAKTFYGSPDDLITTTYESILSGKETKFFKQCFDTERIYIYFYAAMKYQRIKLLKNDKKIIHLDFLENISEEINEGNDIEMYNSILNYVTQLKKEGKISWYQEKLFNLFYNFESTIDIKKLDNEEINEMRAMSLRKMQSLTKINFVSVYYSLKVVKDLIKEKFLTKK